MHYHYFTLEQRASLEQAIRSAINNQHALGRALEHFHTPAYGVCMRCGGDIPYLRLSDRPMALDCGRCR